MTVMVVSDMDVFAVSMKSEVFMAPGRVGADSEATSSETRASRYHRECHCSYRFHRETRPEAT
jgi:hypothetical protein